MTPVPSAADSAARHGFSGKDLGQIDPEQLARLFHETYERLAPTYGYETRVDSRVTWDDVPDNNRQLMIATAAEVLVALQWTCRWVEPDDGR